MDSGPKDNPAELIAAASNEHGKKSRASSMPQRIEQMGKSEAAVQKDDRVDKGMVYESDVGRIQLLDPFEHEPLSSPTSTRILNIKANASYDGPLETELSEIDLSDQHVPYVALSHAWGPNPTLDCNLICNGKRHGITTRIDYALRRIRSRIQSSEFYHWSNIWIDAVCIDQGKDVEAQVEKGKQVGMMHRIFGEAEEVVVDLGKATRLSHMLLMTVEEFDILKDPSMEFERLVKELVPGIANIVFFDKYDQASEIAKKIAAMGDLLQREWFARIWTYQEYILARRISFIVGERVVPGEIMNQSLDVFMTEGNLGLFLTRMLEVMGPSAVNGKDRMLTMQISREVREENPNAPELPLHAVCAVGGMYAASDLRDAVYGVHGLCFNDATAFPIDYTESVAGLSRRAARYLLQSQDNNIFLHAAAGIRSNYASLSDGHSTWGMELGSKDKMIYEDSRTLLVGMAFRMLHPG